MGSAGVGKIAAIGLTLAGVALFLAFHASFPSTTQSTWRPLLLLLPIVMVLTLVNPFPVWVSAIINWLRDPAPRRRAIVAVAVFFFAFGYFGLTARLHDRDLSPRIHDEFSYLIQAHLLSEGKLWTDVTPLQDFFESFHLLVRPVYASIYFPGSAMLYVPGVWLNVPPFVTAFLISALVAMALYLLASELLDGAFGVIAAMLLLAAARFRWMSSFTISHQPAALAGLLIVLLFVYWRTEKSLPRAATFGAALGWAAITRPFDLIAFAASLALLFLLDLRGLPIRRSIRTIAILLACAAPFLSLQLLLNRATSGSWLTTPYRAYIDQYQPGSSLGFPPLPDEPVHTQLQQKRDLYEQWARPALAEHRPATIVPLLLERAKSVVPAALATEWLLILIPLGFVAACRNRQAIPVALAPILFLIAYIFNPYFLNHYSMPIIGPVIILVLFGVRAIAVSFKRTEETRALPYLLMASIAIAALPETNLDFDRERDGLVSLNGLNQSLPEMVQPPAVVLFRYETGESYHVEPVYNYDVANPLDAPIIRAHDLGQRNYELVEYFAKHRPQTMFYRFDKRSFSAIPLGTAAELHARRPPPAHE